MVEANLRHLNEFLVNGYESNRFKYLDGDIFNHKSHRPRTFRCHIVLSFGRFLGSGQFSLEHGYDLEADDQVHDDDNNTAKAPDVLVDAAKKPVSLQAAKGS